jgi:hypothetical protein
MSDYDCVIKSIVIVNEEGIWTQDEATEHIISKYDISAQPYGQVFHVYNINPSGDEWNEYYVVYDGKLMFTEGDQYFRLHFDFTKNIKDIRAKYPEYTFLDSEIATSIPNQEHNHYESMYGQIRGDDPFVKKYFPDNTKEMIEIFDVDEEFDD